ncbi:FAD-dependent oxidoreductase [Streptosporangium sp. H16]|uniref:FAD-dependent oxidoreductase n=1 Tax=Streptosporangium sp. H16 TaxID=3444184 RepID=UPI003F797E82
MSDNHCGTTAAPFEQIMAHAAPGALPVTVVGAGPVGLAAAAHLAERGLDFALIEAGRWIGASLTSLMATGYKQVVAIVGDREAAHDVQLDLPETGMCSSGPAEAQERRVGRPPASAAACSPPRCRRSPPAATAEPHPPTAKESAMSRACPAVARKKALGLICHRGTLNAARRPNGEPGFDLAIAPRAGSLPRRLCSQGFIVKDPCAEDRTTTTYGRRPIALSEARG